MTLTEPNMKIGDKVVCVDDSPCKICSSKIYILENNIYVISATEMSNESKCGLAVQILGIDHNCGSGFANGDRFRLLDELKKQNANKQQQVQAA